MDYHDSSKNNIILRGSFGKTGRWSFKELQNQDLE
jgi:hypothetical protein